MNVFAKPEVGSKLTVTTDWSDHYKTFASYVYINSRHHTLTGTVIASEPQDDPASFRLLTNNTYFPVSVIVLKRVCQLVYDDGTAGAATDQPALSDAETWEVEGSKGNTYIVTRSASTWTCSCPGFSFRQTCKHVNSKKKEVLDRAQ